MNPRKIIAMAEKEGLSLKLMPNRKIKVAGNTESYTKWLPTITEHKEQIIQILEVQSREFKVLYDYLAPLYKWTATDYQAWQEDLAKLPDETVCCLRALKKSWDESRFGVLTTNDWIH
jgi:hypothetical protein